MGVVAKADEGRASLRQRVLNAGGWSLAAFALGQAIRFGTNLIMTRLLVPDVYGVMALAMTIMMGISLLGDIGLRQSVVQSPRGSNPLFLNTVWVTRIGITAITATLIVLVAVAFWIIQANNWLPPGSTYAARDLPIVLACAGLTAFIGGFESTKALEASRHLSIGLLTRMQLGTQIVGLGAMLVAAMFTRSIWVLIVGQIATTALATILTHLVLPGHRNRFQWDRREFKEMLGFGKWILASSVTGFLASSLDKAVLGALVSPATLGTYWIALLLYGAVDQVFSKLSNDVSLSALSEVARERRADLARVFYKFHTPLACVAYGCAAALWFSAPCLVRFLYDSRYEDAGWMLQVLSVGLLGVPSRMHSARLLALGRSRAFFLLVVCGLVVMSAGIPLGYAIADVRGAVWAVVMGQLASLPLALYFSKVDGIVDARRELLPIAAVIPGTLAGMLVRGVLPC